MCGFFITNNTLINSTHESEIEECLRFRGPDCSSGLVEKNGWKAYHSRLSIIEPASGTNQPMIDNKDGMLVYNGEILNYEDLGFKYFSRKYNSDTSLLSDLLCNNLLELSELDGFFSFVYINAEGSLIHAVRDPFGVKPLFYHEDKNGISFSSEPSVLKNLFNCSVNNDAINEYYATRAPIFSGSYFHDVNAIEPGNCYVCGEYFRCDDYLGNYYSNVSNSEIKEAISQGLKTRLVSDVPVGLLLSRGVDSNLLRSLGNFDRFYSIGFAGDEDIEYLRNKNIEGLKTVLCNAEEYKNAFEYLLDLRKEPMSVPNEVMLYLIAKEASNDGIKVLLSGEGADEFFGGYDRIFQWAINKTEFNLDEFLDKYCYIKPSSESELYRSFSEIFDNTKLESVFEKVRWFFIRYHMPVLFRRLDFSLMAAGVEGREPMANMHTFLKAIQTMPSELMGNNLGKMPLRGIISEYMGKDFAYERKVGFPVDLKKVFDNSKGLNSYELWFEENLKVLRK